MTALSVLNRYKFDDLDASGNTTLASHGPGLVLIFESESAQDRKLARLLTAYDAPNDALNLAKNALKHYTSRQTYVYAKIASIISMSERQQALSEVGPMCSEGM